MLKNANVRPLLKKKDLDKEVGGEKLQANALLASFVENPSRLSSNTHTLNDNHQSA